MEVKTQEIIRYIDIRFKEQDLKDLRKNINELTKWFESNPYATNREVFQKFPKITEFAEVIDNAIEEIKS